MKRTKGTKNFFAGLACIGISLVLVSSPACRSLRQGQEVRGEPKISRGRVEIGAQELFEQANEAREKKGLGRLRWNAELAVLAQDHAQKMAASERMSHNGFQQRFDRLLQRGVVTRLTENVAMCQGYSNPVSTTIRGWIDSPGHRRNLYDGDVVVTGVGFAQSDQGAMFYAQLYGR